ncbi:MAG: Alkylation response protein AidB-like acyl-CoA dehydrogenase, partial [Acidimicrobiia bacterium]|nr:Alkylation response protein AidB-like acyl-CoA dehydrogenase [Acidimicrobiia bacterium]
DVIEFCQAMGQQGFLIPHWPAEFGGRDASPWEQAIISELVWAAGEPRGPQYMNTNWIGPALMLAGTEEQKQRYLPPIARGEAMWCQGFSEPDAGSDLASLQTRAVRDGDAYVVNGQKIWTSYAHTADHCFLLVRTDPNTSGGEGITILLVPMDLPGIEVRDIPNPFVEHLFHEIFFNDVVVPVWCRLGDENLGWEIVRQVLANERVGVGRHECSERTLDGAVAAAEHYGLDVEEPSIAATVGMAYAAAEAARALNYAAVNERMHVHSGPRPMASVSRAMTATMEVAVAAACLEALGPQSMLRGSPAERQLAAGTTAPLAAGSLEVQLNLVARLCLNLPKG